MLSSASSSGGGRFGPKGWPTLLRKAGRFAPKGWLFYSEIRNGGVKSFDELTDDLWLDFIKNIEHRSAKDSFKETLVATIEWSKQKNDP